MGGTALTLNVEPIKGREPSPSVFYERLFDVLEKNVRAFAKGKAYQQVLADYLHACKEDGQSSDKSIVFVFKDGSGLCSMSAVATQHWFEVLIAALGKDLDALAADHGLKVKSKRPPLKDALAKCDEPLIELRKNLFAVGVERKKPYLISDDLDEDTLDYESLKPAEQKEVARVATKKKCECQVCEALRAKKPLKPVAAPVRERTPKQKYKPHSSGYLALTDQSLTTFPMEVTELDLRSLTLNGLKITTLPEELANIPSLEELSLVDMNLTQLPESFSRLKLVRLGLTRTTVPSLEPLYGITTLRELRMTESESIAALLDLARLPHLEVLSIHGCKLRELSPAISALWSLRELQLYFNELTTLPDLPQLRKLSVGNNKLAEVPASIATLLGLEELNLEGNPITMLGEHALPHGLHELNLTDCPLDALPASVGELTALENLKLKSEKLAPLPESLRTLKTLKYFQLSHYAHPLPAWLGDFTEMEYLALTDGKFTSLPDSMRAMKSLRRLTLWHSKVFPLPDWIAELQQLADLDVHKDDLPRGELARLRRLLPKTRINL
jgi:Leucine-rich repeat (LRR) protein